jgi:hypothetical protein
LDMCIVHRDGVPKVWYNEGVAHTELARDLNWLRKFDVAQSLVLSLSIVRGGFDWRKTFDVLPAFQEVYITISFAWYDRYERLHRPTARGELKDYGISLLLHGWTATVPITALRLACFIHLCALYCMI